MSNLLVVDQRIPIEHNKYQAGDVIWEKRINTPRSGRVGITLEGSELYGYDVRLELGYYVDGEFYKLEHVNLTSVAGPDLGANMATDYSSSSPQNMYLRLLCVGPVLEPGAPNTTVGIHVVNYARHDYTETYLAKTKLVLKPELADKPYIYERIFDVSQYQELRVYACGENLVDAAVRLRVGTYVGGKDVEFYNSDLIGSPIMDGLTHITASIVNTYGMTSRVYVRVEPIIPQYSDEISMGLFVLARKERVR